jgi:hypothetical protein
MSSFTESFATTARSVVDLGTDATAIAGLDDEALVAAHTLLTTHRQHVETYVAWLTGEIARRSRLGYAGLAQRKGFGSAEALIQSISPVTRAEASRFVALGILMTDAAAPAGSDDVADTAPTQPLPPWQAALARSLTDGALSLAGADAIRRGLADLDSASDDSMLAAVDQLLAEARELTVDQLFARARTLRDRIDEEGIARREKERRDNRFLKRWVRADGMYQGSFVLDPEAGREVFSALDAIIAPRRGGPRFVDAAAQARAQAVRDDARTDDQLLADAFVEMIRLAADADPGRIFGTQRPAVRVMVTEHTLAHDGGHGFLEGDPQAVSRETVDRHICNTGMIGIRFDDDGQVINLGRTKRLFTERQRIGLAVRDGGCRFGDCARPPSACEAHHIDQWHRDRGKTDIADGILLCRHHHMLVHNNHWRIVREGGRYWARPPRSEDPDQRLRPLVSRNPLLPELVPQRS